MDAFLCLAHPCRARCAAQAKETANKYRGVSSEDMMRGGSSYGSGSYGSGGYGSGGSGSASGYGAVGAGPSAGRPPSSSAPRSSGSHAPAAVPPPPPPAVDLLEGEDPFEATRRRIEAQRASAAATAAAHDGPAPALGSINMDASANLFPGAWQRQRCAGSGVRGAGGLALARGHTRLRSPALTCS